MSLTSTMLLRQINRIGVRNFKCMSTTLKGSCSTTNINKTNYNHHLSIRSHSSAVEKDEIFISINHNVKEDNVPESGKLLNPLLEETVEITESTNNSSSEDEMEQEEMFVQPHFSLGTEKIEWGGPRRGGRIAEPTRFGDWERKGRCTDF